MLSTSLLILIFTLIGGYVDFKLSTKETPKNVTNKKGFYVTQFIVCLIIGGSAYYVGIGDQKQKDNIEILSQKNSDLEIQNQGLIVDVHSLEQVNNRLIDSSRLLLNKLSEISDRINQTTTSHSEENALSGTLHLDSKSPLKDTDMIWVIFGGKSGSGNYVKQIKTWNPPPCPILLKGICPITVKIVDNRILVSMTVYDTRGNLIVDIIDNNWRRNPNFTGKFNYDNSGFEIVDNQNNTALNLNLVNNSRIEMQGYIVLKDHGEIVISGTKKQLNFFRIATTDQSEQEINAELAASGITQLFQYGTKKWLHKRVPIKKMRPRV